MTAATRAIAEKVLAALYFDPGSIGHGEKPKLHEENVKTVEAALDAHTAHVVAFAKAAERGEEWATLNAGSLGVAPDWFRDLMFVLKSYRESVNRRDKD